MNPIRFLSLAAGLVALLAAGCGSSGDDTSSTPATGTAAAAATTPATTQKVSLALDWTANTNHTGVFVADKLGLYKKHGIELEVLPYASTAPETLVSNGKADFGFSYQAGVAYARAAGADVVAVYSPAAKGLYAIGVRADDDAIQSPKDLDGKTYAGFGTPDEGPELEYIIQQDGGTGDFETVTLDTAAYQAVYSGKADFTIPVVTWEGVEAGLVGKPLKFFDLEDYGFPTQYSTLIISSEKYLSANPEVAKAFIAATAEGYEYAAEHPAEAAKILQDANPGVLKNDELVVQSQELLAKDYMKDAQGRIGYQDPEVWEKYGSFLFDNGLLVDGEGEKLTTKPDWSTFYTNDLLPAQ